MSNNNKKEGWWIIKGHTFKIAVWAENEKEVIDTVIKSGDYVEDDDNKVEMYYVGDDKDFEEEFK